MKMIEEEKENKNEAKRKVLKRIWEFEPGLKGNESRNKERERENKIFETLINVRLHKNFLCLSFSLLFPTFSPLLSFSIRLSSILC